MMSSFHTYFEKFPYDHKNGENTFDKRIMYCCGNSASSTVKITSHHPAATQHQFRVTKYIYVNIHAYADNNTLILFFAEISEK